jgi:hypothetical protein
MENIVETLKKEGTMTFDRFQDVVRDYKRKETANLFANMSTVEDTQNA